MVFPSVVSALIKDLIISATEAIAKKPIVNKLGAEEKIILSENNPKNIISKGFLNNETKMAAKKNKKYHGIKIIPKNISKKNSALFVICF